MASHVMGDGAPDKPSIGNLQLTAVVPVAYPNFNTLLARKQSTVAKPRCSEFFLTSTEIQPLRCTTMSAALCRYPILTHTDLHGSMSEAKFRDLIESQRPPGICEISHTNCEAVLSDSATPSNLNASNFLTVKDNITFNTISGMLSSRAIQNIPDMLGYL